MNPVISSIGKSHTASRDEFRGNLRSQKWRFNFDVYTYRLYTYVGATVCNPISQLVNYPVCSLSYRSKAGTRCSLHAEALLYYSATEFMMYLVSAVLSAQITLPQNVGNGLQPFLLYTVLPSTSIKQTTRRRKNATRRNQCKRRCGTSSCLTLLPACVRIHSDI